MEPRLGVAMAQTTAWLRRVSGEEIAEVVKRLLKQEQRPLKQEQRPRVVALSPSSLGIGVRK